MKKQRLLILIIIGVLSIDVIFYISISGVKNVKANGFKSIPEISPTTGKPVQVVDSTPFYPRPDNPNVFDQFTYYSDGSIVTTTLWDDGSTQNTTYERGTAGYEAVLAQLSSQSPNGDDIVRNFLMEENGGYSLISTLRIFDEQGIAGESWFDIRGYGIGENGLPLTPFDYNPNFQYAGSEILSGGGEWRSYYYISADGSIHWAATKIDPTTQTIYYAIYDEVTGRWIKIGQERYGRGGAGSGGGSCYCCQSHTETYTTTNPDGTTSTESETVCDKYCERCDCYWKSCDGGCCCNPHESHYSVDCGDSCGCPSSTCSSNCDCCGGNGSCYPRVFLDIDPPKLFVGQSFNFSYEAEGDSCCGGLRCTVTGTYQGFNCGQSGMIGICPSDAQGVNVCDPKNQLRSLTSSSGSATITTHSQYWGNCLYKVTCTNSCGNSSSDTQTVMTVPVPLWGEESPISNLFSPLKPFISLFSL